MASNKKLIALVLAENVYENLELHYPRLRLQEAGLNVLVVAPEAGKIYTSKEGYPVTSDCDFKSVDPAQVAVIVVPGGFAPDKLRRYKECLELVSNCVKNGACVGSICHGPWVLISAKVVKGRRVTSVSAIKDDLENAGAIWVDSPCVVDDKFVTAQLPKDLPAMMSSILKIVG